MRLKLKNTRNITWKLTLQYQGDILNRAAPRFYLFIYLFFLSFEEFNATCSSASTREKIRTFYLQIAYRAALERSALRMSAAFSNFHQSRRTGSLLFQQSKTSCALTSAISEQDRNQNTYAKSRSPTKLLLPSDETPQLQRS